MIEDGNSNEVKGKITLVRVDLNIPVKNGVIKNDTKIVNLIPFLVKLLDERNKVILVPSTKINDGTEKSGVSTADMALRISKHLKSDVRFKTFQSGDDLRESISTLNIGEVMLLDNFHVDSTCDGQDKWRYLSSFGDSLVFFRPSNKNLKDKNTVKEADWKSYQRYLSTFK